MLQSSLSRFSTGVPVRAKRAFAEISFTAFAPCVFAFLMTCASSIISYSNVRPRYASRSRFNRS